VRICSAGVRANRQDVSCANRVGFCTRGWTSRETAVVTTQIRGQRALGKGCTGAFQQNLLLRRINQTQVVDAGVHLRRAAGADEVRNRDGGQETDNRNHDHDFNERKARLAGGIDLHTVCYFLSFPRREQYSRRVIY
jgi:hypothetical protein